MSLSILNNISALTAENNLNSTQASLQNTLTQLSSGSRINSGSDDPAGLSIANGLTANIAALTQSVQNATNGTGLLQTADGALSQVTTLLNQAVTLATEASNGGLTGTQGIAIQNEYATILTQIGNIGTTTNFNGKQVFVNNNNASFTSTQAGLLSTSDLTVGKEITINDAQTGGTFVYTVPAANTIAGLTTAVTNAVAAGTLSAGTTAGIVGGKLVIATTTNGDSLTVTNNDSALGVMNPTTTTANSASVYMGDGTALGANSVTTSITNLTTANLGLGTVADALETTSTAATELNAINTAISTVASWRGTIGANVNDLTAATNVMNNQIPEPDQRRERHQRCRHRSDGGKYVQYTTLQQTGIAALQQANQASQSILKLLQ